MSSASNRGKRLLGWLRAWKPYRRCGAMSPEGLFCDLADGHEGLHAPAIGNGWAWEAITTTPSDSKPTISPYSDEAATITRERRKVRNQEQRERTAETLRLLASCLDTLADAIVEDDHIIGPMASTGVANHLSALPRELRETFAECVSDEAARSLEADRRYLEALS